MAVRCDVVQWLQHAWPIGRARRRLPGFLEWRARFLLQYFSKPWANPRVSARTVAYQAPVRAVEIAGQRRPKSVVSAVYLRSRKPLNLLSIWCEERDLNPYELPHRNLKPRPHQLFTGFVAGPEPFSSISPSSPRPNKRIARSVSPCARCMYRSVVVRCLCPASF